MGFGDIIRSARQDAGLTQEELGKRVGVSGVSIGNWEKDKSRPLAGHAQRLIEVLGIEPLELLESDVRIAMAAGLRPNTRSVVAGSYTAPLFDARGASAKSGEATALAEVPVIASVFEAHPNGFFTPMEDESMSRVFPQGSLCYVDPDAEVQNGDAVAVSVNEGPARIVRIHTIKNDIILEPDSYSDAFTNEVIRDESATVRIIGRVVHNISDPRVVRL